MQVDAKYGIIPDTQAQILANYLSFFQNVFPDANSPDDPTYVIASTCAYFDSLNQNALEVLWNSINANTANGLGLDVLANTTLNLFRRPLMPSTCIIQLVVQNLLSYCDILIDVTVSSPQTLSSGWAVSGSVSPSPAYATLQNYAIPSSGTYTVRVFSTDVTTEVAIGDFNAGASSSGITFVSVSNPGEAILGSLVIPADWAVTASTLNPSPVYTPNQVYTYKANGTYYLLLYSSDILTNVNIGQLNTFPQINNLAPTPQPMIAGIYNANPNILGKPPESDEQFSIRRRYFLNVEGETYYGLENVINNLNIPALRSLFIRETITDTYNSSFAIIKVTITYTGTPVVIPVGWAVYKSSGPFPSPDYKTLGSYTFSTSGTQYIPVFSTDGSTPVGIGGFTSGDVVTGVTFVGNLDPAILNATIGLGQRGYTVYLGYPLNGPGGTTFDTQDIYLQQIASACFKYHPLGTQFYSGGSGATTFDVRTPYSGYTSSVILNPLQISEATVTLTLIYNADPEDAGFSNGIFPIQYILDGSLKIRILNIINNYFNSKTLPTDLVYSITELSELIQTSFAGIVALSSPTVPFTFGTISPSASDLLFLRRPLGYTFNLLDSNFSFTATNKDLL